MRVLILVLLCVWWTIRHVKSLDSIGKSLKGILHIDDIFQNMKTVFHVDDIYQMNIFITRTLQQLVPSHDERFEAQSEKIHVLRSSIDRLTDEVSTMFTHMDQKLDRLLVKTEEISIRPGPNLKEIDEMIYLLKKEGSKMSVVLHQCHQLSQRIRDELMDNNRLIVKSFDI
jgi:hypothetical protein